VEKNFICKFMSEQKTPSLFKIAITGPESTGKSTLAAQLATHYQTLFVPEFARYYLAHNDTPYQKEDLILIAKGQQAFEQALSTQANQILIADTEMLVMNIWYKHSYQFNSPWLSQKLQEQSYDLYLLMGIDLPWQPDPQREHPNLRGYFFNLYHRNLEKMKANFGIISGSGEERLQKAIQLIEIERAKKES
jgi:NadR type nicotinamide-nucleotide adenylyltransferase